MRCGDQFTLQLNANVAQYSPGLSNVGDRHSNRGHHGGDRRRNRGHRGGGRRNGRGPGGRRA